MSFQSANRPSLSVFEYGAYGISLNLNCGGKFEVEGPQPPSGLSFIVGNENEAILVLSKLERSAESRKDRWALQNKKSVRSRFLAKSLARGITDDHRLGSCHCTSSSYRLTHLHDY